MAVCVVVYFDMLLLVWLCVDMPVGVVAGIVGCANVWLFVWLLEELCVLM